MEIVTTSWVAPMGQVGGQDHLAVRAPCERMYTQLLPGITNLTDRARYYTFYPWLLWRLEQSGASLDTATVTDAVRRAECLLCWIGEGHARALEIDAHDDAHHGRRLVGRQKLLPALDLMQAGESVEIARYSAEEGPTRYFANSLGGLGQYYRGALRNDLGVLISDSKRVVGYSQQRGRQLAEALDPYVDGERFFAAMYDETVNIDTVNDLAAFCPCTVAENDRERAVLADLLFGWLDDAVDFDDAPARRATLALVLDFVARQADQPDTEEYSELNLLRTCLYSGSLVGGEAWEPTGVLDVARRQWAVYQRNEFLALAMQGIFWSVLQRWDDLGTGPRSVEHLPAWFVADCREAVLGNAPHETFAARVARTREALPDLAQWTKAGHEVQLASQLLDAYAKRRNTVAGCHEVARCGLELLVALAARSDGSASQYGQFEFEAGYFSHYPINLASLAHHASRTWPALSLEQVLGWLVTRWGAEVHLQVALRKLRDHGQNTFRLLPDDDGLRRAGDAPAPTFSNPRLWQGMQMLVDIGALERPDWNTNAKLTSSGKALLERCRG